MMIIPIGPIEPVTLSVSGGTVTRDVTPNFNDPEDDPLTFTVISSDTTVATASVSGSVVTVTPVAVGSATITVTAQDLDGSSANATETIDVMVVTNQAPTAVGTITPVDLTVGGTATRDVASNFSDPDNDSLTFTVESAAEAVATVSISGSTVTVTAVAVGSTTITVTAQDPDGLSVNQTIAVMITTPPLAAPTALTDGSTTVFGNAAQCGGSAEFIATPTINSGANTVAIAWELGSGNFVTAADTITLTLDDDQSQMYAFSSASITTTFNILPTSAGLVQWAVTFTAASGRADCVERGQLTLPTFVPPPPRTAELTSTQDSVGTATQCGANAFEIVATINSAQNTVVVRWITNPTISNISTVTVTLDGEQSQDYPAPPPVSQLTTFDVSADTAGLVKWVVTFSDSTADCEETHQLTTLPTYVAPPPNVAVGTAAQCGLSAFNTQTTINTATNTIEIDWTTAFAKTTTSVTLTLDDGQSQTYNAPLSISDTKVFNILSDSMGLVKFVATYVAGGVTANCEETLQLTLPAYVALPTTPVAPTVIIGTAGQCGSQSINTQTTINTATNTITIGWANVFLGSAVDTVTVTLDNGQSQVYASVLPNVKVVTTFNILSDSDGLVKFAVTFTDGAAACEETLQLTLP